MIKKSISLVLVVMLLSGLLSCIPASAAEADNAADSSQIKTLTLEVEDNMATYYDENGNEVDINDFYANPYAGRKQRTALPSSYDLRDYGRSTSVKDQGDYGFCWSFASTASMESNILTKGLGNETSDSLDLSETGNAWYLCTNTDDPSSPIYNEYLDDHTKGANGGVPEYAADSLSSGFGAYPEELVSYSDFESGYPESLRFYSDYRLEDYVNLPYDIDLIKQRIIDNGAVFYGYYSCFDNYYIANGVETYYNMEGTGWGSGHAVTVIGWDDNFSKENFGPENQPENDGAWLCKNSWGENYQENVKDEYKGYFWVSYESYVHDVAQFVMQDSESFDNVYQHQVTGDTYLYTETEAGLISGANVFTANSNEKLEQICFSNMGTTDVTTKIYKLSENYTSPVDGKLLTEFTTRIDFSGTHCLDVPKDIVLSEGDIFSVVIQGENLILKFNENPNEETDTAGKSYFSDVENIWSDTANDSLSYAAIKAYTSDLSVDKSQLKALVKKAKKLKPDDNADDTLIAEFNRAIREAKKVLSDKNATSNKVSNAYCVLKNKYDTLDNYTFKINSMDDFTAFLSGEVSSKYIELNTDLNCAETDFFQCYEPINLYNVTFDGNGHTISNLTLTERSSDHPNLALFDEIKCSVIKDITFDNAYVCDQSYNNSVIAYKATDCEFINCNVKNSTVKSYDTNMAALMTIYSSNCTFKNCTIENSTAVGRRYSSLFSYTSNCTFENCKASDYTLMASRDVCDNIGFDVSYNHINYENSYDATPLITVTDDTCTIQPLIGEINSFEYNGVQLSPVDGVYNIEKTDGAVCPDITFNDLEPSDFNYTVDLQNRDITVDDYSGTDSDIVIPDSIHGLPVTNIKYDLKCWNCDATSISIPGSVKTFLGLPSERFRNLQSLTINEGVETIENWAFTGFGGLSQINLPDSLRTIGDIAFLSCNATEITLGKNIEEIGEFAIGYHTTAEGYAPIENFTIHGYAGTAAETYANENGFDFVDLSTTD